MSQPAAMTQKPGETFESFAAVVCDTSVFGAIAKFLPQNATTNLSLNNKAATMPECSKVVRNSAASNDANIVTTSGDGKRRFEFMRAVPMDDDLEKWPFL